MYLLCDQSNMCDCLIHSYLKKTVIPACSNRFIGDPATHIHGTVAVRTKVGRRKKHCEKFQSRLGLQFTRVTRDRDKYVR